MSTATVLLIVALVSLSISIAGGIYIWRRHSYSVRDERFQGELWRALKLAQKRDSQQHNGSAFR